MRKPNQSWCTQSQKGPPHQIVSMAGWWLYMTHWNKSYSRVTFPTSPASLNSTLNRDVLTTSLAGVQYVQVPIKGRRNQVDVFLDIGANKAKIFLATVNLRRLGFHTKWQRRCGKIEHIYVLGQIPGADGALEPVSHSIPSSPEI